ncbi:MAG: hypothetical protein GY941_29405, partial [Planctomycetes bacterium]|nr:hypothetical protein [Planctomycetota bacterium]
AIQPATYYAYDITESAIVSANNSYYSVPAGHTVELRKTVTMPVLNTYADSEVASIGTFGSYQQKELDLKTTWTIDETIDFLLYASLGASPASYSLYDVNEYIISR